MIELKNISKSYTRANETTKILENLSLTIADGEFVALMGPSGSGKTTLLNIVSALDRPDSGEVTVYGEKLNLLSEKELNSWRASNISFIFQFYNLIPVLSAIENVALPLSLFGIPPKERMERAKFALELVGLGERLHHKPSELSGGQEQRVAIARAIVTDPKCIVADEPTGDLDRVSADSILLLLRELNKSQKKTILMVTHDQSAADRADRVIKLDKGRLA